jgi:ribosomal protein S18 acetylase RimI-like enzyme
MKNIVHSMAVGCYSRYPRAQPGIRLRALSIRPYRPEDRAAVYEICLRTGDDGADARGLLADPDLMGHVYAGPYLALCPELAFVVQERSGAVTGYVLGALDTAAFVAAYRARWLPSLAGSHPPPSGPPATLDEDLRDRLHRPELLLDPAFPDHPSHLHVNLLPGAQGHGQGRALIATFCDALRAAGSPGVHLGVRRRNERAAGFYAHIGFTELRRTSTGVFFGRALDARSG